MNQQGTPIGIITNGPVNRQTDKINALQLTNWIDQENIIISDGVQIQKPDPGIFRLMEAKLNLTPDSLLYVGDSFDNDVLGAKAAGWSVWWFNHQRRMIPSDQTAIYDDELTSFKELNNAFITKKSLQH
ncbi:HAD family hydrolase [Enterococcus xiangfangensis]|uniref:HAD family hydrolase n=1 Tax=Enterococcus xiangfangensis TaxID=1296537 RepID=UPI003D17B1D1